MLNRQIADDRDIGPAIGTWPGGFHGADRGYARRQILIAHCGLVRTLLSGNGKGTDMQTGIRIKLAFWLMMTAVTVPALAQSDVRGQGVADRPRPDFDPYGYPVGAFTLYPSVTTAVLATNNYLATDTNKRGDLYAVVSPEVQLSSNWVRNRLTARAYFNQSLHANLSNQNIAQYGVSLGGALDVSHATQITADTSAGHYVENRADLGSFQGTSEPVTYSAYRARLGISQNFNRLTLNGSVALNELNYNNIPVPGGPPINQHFRDVRAFTGVLSAQYEVASGIGLILTGQYDNNFYSFRPGQLGFDPLINIDRASSGFNLEGGITFELSSLVFGSIQFGLLSRNYRDARLRDFQGPSYSANILWNVTPLTSLRLTAQRSVEDASSTVVAGNTRSDLKLFIDHELYRYIILSGDLGYGSFTPNGPGVGGQEFTVGAGARYLIDRRWSVGANLRHSQRSSESSFLRYQATTASVSVKFAF